MEGGRQDDGRQKLMSRQYDDENRIMEPRTLGTRTTRASTLGLLKNFELIEQMSSIARGTREGSYSLVGNWDDSGLHNDDENRSKTNDPDA